MLSRLYSLFSLKQSLSSSLYAASSVFSFDVCRWITLRQQKALRQDTASCQRMNSGLNLLIRHGNTSCLQQNLTKQQHSRCVNIDFAQGWYIPLLQLSFQNSNNAPGFNTMWYYFKRNQKGFCRKSYELLKFRLINSFEDCF